MVRPEIGCGAAAPKSFTIQNYSELFNTNNLLSFLGAWRATTGFGFLANAKRAAPAYPWRWSPVGFEC